MPAPNLLFLMVDQLTGTLFDDGVSMPIRVQSRSPQMPAAAHARAMPCCGSVIACLDVFLLSGDSQLNTFYRAGRSLCCTEFHLDPPDFRARMPAKQPLASLDASSRRHDQHGRPAN